MFDDRSTDNRKGEHLPLEGLRPEAGSDDAVSEVVERVRAVLEELDPSESCEVFALLTEELLDVREPRDDSSIPALIDAGGRLGGATQRLRLKALRWSELRGLWAKEYLRNATEYASIHLDCSHYEAGLALKASHALERLPGLSSALGRGELPVMKVLHLARYLSPEDETKEIRWARNVTLSTVRSRAELKENPGDEEAVGSARTSVS